jgi:hypothetical protein
MVKINKNIINKKNKRGWVRLVEAFLAIVLLTSVLLVISNTNSTYKNDVQNEISKKQVAILRDIQLNEDLRAEILSATLPVEWENFDSSGLSEVRDRIEALSPKDLKCSAKLCTIDEPCIIKDNSGGDVYAKSVFISANLNIYSPRQLKLFCTKE